MGQLNDVIIKKGVAARTAERVEAKGNGFKPSTFAKVHETKTAPVQVHLDKELSKIIGTSYLLIAAEEQKATDSKSGQVTSSTVYTVRVISNKAKAYRELIQIKVKNSRPIIQEDELDKVMMQIAKPIILRFNDIAHYAFMGGESLNASGVERLNVSVKEAMEHE